MEDRKTSSIKDREGTTVTVERPRTNTNSNAVVVSLPPAFQGFLRTRDGGKGVIVPTSHLAKKWANVYYKNPQNPLEILSNNFMLRNCKSVQIQVSKGM